MNVTKDLILIPYLTLSNGTKIDVTKELEHYGYRTMWDIVQSCALTIFACTWATMHPNIPSHRCSPSELYYKVQLWIVDLIMPELLLLWAAKQYFAARNLAKKRATEDTTAEGAARSEEEGANTTASSLAPLLRRHSTALMTRRLSARLKGFFTARDKAGNYTSDWTMTQAFFALMGGLQDKAGHILSPYASGSLIEKPTDEEIGDKNKTDSFVKLLAFAQTLWFVMNTIYRIQSPVLYATEAEVVTFTFACLSVITNFFWWNKPQGVGLPLPIHASPIPSQNNQSCTDNPNDAPPPNCFELATSILQFDSFRPVDTSMHDRFISKSDIYTYNGELSWDEMAIAVLCASFFGSLSGVCHLTVASLHGELTTSRGTIWFSFACLGSALSFYLLLVISISVLKVRGTGKGDNLLRHALNAPIGQVFLTVSVIGRIALIVALIYFMFSPYDYTAFLTPDWSQYIPHPF